MVPFHELTDRLIISARNYGGHKELLTYYFRNSPAGYLYKRKNLTLPVKTKEVTAVLNKSYTTAIIISDAGFARAYGSDERFESRKQSAIPFLELLKDCCAHTIWLNPMPENRWEKKHVADLTNEGGHHGTCFNAKPQPLPERDQGIVKKTDKSILIWQGFPTIFRLIS
ncbi:MAG: hypothetical protein LRY55_02655 [Leadbetterella sp.]|nr:hypothetical protein [Leadbetterella sp.]